jgi:hypothetical protein
MPTPTELVRAALRFGSPDRALEHALRAAREAGRGMLTDTRGRSAAERFAVALQAATEALDGLAVEMAGDVGTPTRPES